MLSMVVAGGHAYPHDPGRVAGLVVATCVVLWLAHVYAHALGESLAQERRLSLAELRHVARREGSIVEAAVPPVAALLLGAIGVLSARAALWLALGLALAVLLAQGLVFARSERLGWAATLAVVTANLALGLLLVALKLLVIH